MKPTGLVRRIDDLGRVAIPKEVRRNLRIREGDPLEIFAGDDSVIFKIVDDNEGISSIIHDLRAYIENDTELCRNHDLIKKVGEIESMVKQG